MRASYPHATHGILLAMILIASSWPLPAAETGSKPLDCPAIEGIDGILAPGAVVLLGEIHGTAESPGFLSATACHALSKSLTVTMALELPQSEQTLVDAFLNSKGADADRKDLLNLPFWRRSYQDGRTSHAMLEVVEDARRWRQAGMPIHVLLIDNPAAFRERDREMAKAVLDSLKMRPGDVHVALVGNLHNRAVPGSGRMGGLVAAAGTAKSLHSLNASHKGGSAWLCTSSDAAGCGAVSLSGRSERPGLEVEMFEKLDPRGYHGVYHVGRINASPPAKDPLPGGEEAGSRER
jgi:hypothetical protein